MKPIRPNNQPAKRDMDKESLRYCEEMEKIEGNPNAKQIANLFRKGQLEGDILRDVREILKDPNKMKDDEYKWFIKALAAGKFPKKGKNALKFIKALNGTEEERKYAREVIKDLKEESSGPMSERAERNHLKKLSELREEAVKSKTLEEVAGGTGTITASADIHSAVEQAVSKKKKNWEPDKMPEDLVKELDRLEGRQVEIAEESNKLDRELKEELRKEEPDKVKVDTLEQKIKALDAEFEEIGDELKDPKKKEVAHLSQQLNKMRAIEKLGWEIGLSIGKVNKLKIWALRPPDMEADDAESSKKIQGIIVNQATGKAEKEKSAITITGIRFDRERTDYEDDAAGDMIVEYVNENGETEEAGYTTFVKILNGCEAYEDMESLDEVNEKLEEELGYLPLKEGMELSAEIAVSVDETGVKKENKKIRIRAIDEKEKTITLEEPAVKISRKTLGSSVDNAMYFDRIQRTFEYGEFVRFVKQNRYKRTLKADEMDRVLAAASERTNRECAEIEKETAAALGNKRKRISKVETAAFTPPKEGEGGRVIYLMDDTQLRKGRLTKEPRSEDYIFESISLQEPGKDGPDIETLVANGLPMHMASAQQAKTQGEWKKRRISGRSLMELQNAGGIANAGAGEIGGNIPTLADLTGPESHSRRKAHGRHEEPEEEHGEHEEGGHEGPGEHGEHGEGEHKKVKYNEESLPYDVVHKVGGFKTKEVNFLKTYWDNTRFFSCDDIWQMGKAMWEYYERRFERRQKERYSKVGEEIPFWSPEMRRVNQASENEQVNQFKESYEQKGIFEIEERLWTTRNKDEMKAALTVLAEKGHIRWDNIQLWKNLNRFVDPRYAIPIPANGDPYTRLNAKDNQTGMDFLKPAIDSLWGEGQYNEWYSSCKSHSQSHAKGYYEEGKELEGVDGGHGLRLKTLLHQHKMGIFVDPHEYEGLILHSIEAGKSQMQEKIYFMIEGVTAQNPHGHTIMPFERIAHINSEMLARFPILEYICADVPRPPDGKKYRFTLDDYKSWAKMFDMGNPMNCEPTRAVNDFMWKYVIPSDETQNRINKALRNGENLDHDDMFAYLPPATEEVITDACTATTGRKKFLTIEGYANVIPGFSQYMRSLAETDNRNKLREAIKSYVRFESIMTNRYDKGDTIYQRLKYSVLNSPTIVSDEPPQAFMDQMNPAIKKIIAAYNDPRLNELAGLMYINTPNFKIDKGEQELQKKVEWALEHFGEVFDKVVKSDNGEKMTQIIEESNFTGMPRFMSSAEKDKRKAMYTDKFSLD